MAASLLNTSLILAQIFILGSDSDGCLSFNVFVIVSRSRTFLASLVTLLMFGGGVSLLLIMVSSAKCFAGVYPRDILKSIKKTLQMIIVNTDPSIKTGKHWILLYFTQRQRAEIFDSLGNDVTSYHSSIKKFIKRHSTHYVHAVHHRIQPKRTALCRHYCLYYAYSRCEGMSAKIIVHTMPSPQWIKKMYSHTI